MGSAPLVVRFGWMGDMVFLLAFIRALHDRLGSAIDVVASGAWTPTLLERQYGVGKAYWIRSRKDRYWLTPQQWRLVEALRRRGATPTWICEDKSDKGRWLVSRAGVPAGLIADLHAWPRRNGEHEVDRLLRFARVTPPMAALEERPPPQSSNDVARAVPPLVIAPEWRRDAEAWLGRYGLSERPFILIQPGSRSTTHWHRPYRRASNRKYWPPESWAAVVDAISDLELDAEILLTGVPAEAALNDTILNLAHSPRAHNIAHDLPLSRLLALQERASGMISVDTGPAHSAAALACPLVVIFGIEDPATYEPRSPTGAVQCLSAEVDGERSMLGVSPQQVLSAWEKLPRRA